MIVVTTPTGAIGRQVLAHLLDRDAPVRVIARDPSRLPPHVRDRVEVVVGAHDDAGVVDTAFTGAAAVFWLVPPDPRAPTALTRLADFTRPACRAFGERGVRRVVGISALGRGTPMAADAGLVTASLMMDDLIAATGVDYRALVLPSFMENLLRDVASIRDGVYAAPTDPARKAPLCATRDIAAVAADLLLDSSWTGQGSVAVLGPEDLSADDMVRIMSEVLDRPVRFEQLTDVDYQVGLRAYGVSAEMARAMVDMMRAKDAGLDAAEPRTPASSSPTSFRQWCQEVLRPAVLG